MKTIALESDAVALLPLNVAADEIRPRRVVRHTRPSPGCVPVSASSASPIAASRRWAKPSCVWCSKPTPTFFVGRENREKAFFEDATENACPDALMSADARWARPARRVFKDPLEQPVQLG